MLQELDRDCGRAADDESLISQVVNSRRICRAPDPNRWWEIELLAYLASRSARRSDRPGNAGPAFGDWPAGG